MHVRDGNKFKSLGWFGFDPSKEYRAIGWLGNRPLVVGHVPKEILPALIRLACSDVRNPTRGFHFCEYCGREEVMVAIEGGRMFRLGSAEVWVPGADSIVYRAPNLIIHYIGDHGYQPPQEFIEAVMKLAAASG